MKRKDFVREIEQAGWNLIREGGSHSVYAKKGRNFPVPRHKEIKEGMVRGWRRLNREIDEES